MNNSHTLIFATGNSGKINEVKQLLNGHFEIIPMRDAGISDEIPEPFDTLEANAGSKSGTIFARTKTNCFSEDTGLFVESLKGAPGVKSARYAGDKANNQDNIRKLLSEMEGKTNRRAAFRTIISLRWNGIEHLFEGVCNGTLLESPRGEQGFGYDAIFMPDGSDKSFAEMDMATKNLFSHRKKAVQQLIQFLQTQIT
jgi:XTP/dITP diphosphohydrolase